MLKVAVLDDYQNVFTQIINVKEHETDYNFTVFNEKFQNEIEITVLSKKIKDYQNWRSYGNK